MRVHDCTQQHSRETSFGVLPLEASKKNEEGPSRVRRWRRRLRQHAVAIMLAVATKAAPAYARKGDPVSLRPGVTLTEIEIGESANDAPLALSGEAGSLMEEATGQQTPPKQQATKQKVKKKKVKSDSFDYGDIDEDEEELKKDAEIRKQNVLVVDKEAILKESPATNKAQAMSNFRAAPQKQQDPNQVTKTIVLLSGPFVAFPVVRGVFQERKNQKTLTKALEIMDAQKAEYFNITSSNATDAQIQDELDNLKNETSTDEEEDDADDENDDDDNDDTPPQESRRKPKGGGSGGGSSSGGGEPPETGGGRPSEEDLDRLKKTFNRS